MLNVRRERREILAARRTRVLTRSLLVHEAIERLKREPRYQREGSLIPYGYKVYSQNDEDGIIREIFNRIGLTNRKFLEFGIGDGLENNTLALLFERWTGVWIEANRKSVENVSRGFSSTIASRALTVVNSLVTKDNIDDLIKGHFGAPEIDLLSVDIDGNDFHVFDAISAVVPRVVVIEYNAKFRPPIMYCMDYDATHAWRGDDNFGASLQFLEAGFARKGYCLVACNLTGTNAFFVRSDLVAERFLRPFSAEMHYEPARYHLAGFDSGHPPSYAALDRSLRSRRADSDRSTGAFEHSRL